MLSSELGIGLPETAVLYRFLQQGTKSFAERGKIDSVLRTFWSGHGRLNLREVQFEIDRVVDFSFARHAEHFLGAKIILERRALFFRASGRAQIRDRLGV